MDSENIKRHVLACARKVIPCFPESGWTSELHEIYNAASKIRLMKRDTDELTWQLQQVQARHAHELAQIQASCPHSLTSLQDKALLVCDICGKVL